MSRDRKKLGEDLDGLDKARGEHQREIAQRFPAYYALVNPKAPTLPWAAARGWGDTERLGKGRGRAWAAGLGRRPGRLELDARDGL